MDSDEDAVVVFKSSNNDFVIVIGEGLPQKDVVAEKKGYGRKSARLTIKDGYGIQKVK
jgi:hypothetical protein